VSRPRNSPDSVHRGGPRCMCDVLGPHQRRQPAAPLRNKPDGSQHQQHDNRQPPATTPCGARHMGCRSTFTSFNHRHTPANDGWRPQRMVPQSVSLTIAADPCPPASPESMSDFGSGMGAAMLGQGASDAVIVSLRRSLTWANAVIWPVRQAAHRVVVLGVGSFGGRGGSVPWQLGHGYCRGVRLVCPGTWTRCCR
jgi:hypothetical protein